MTRLARALWGVAIGAHSPPSSRSLSTDPVLADPCWLRRRESFER